MPANAKPSGSPWPGYAFAVVVTAVAYVFRFEVDRLIGDTISLPLCALAAVFACLWTTGLGPALLATVLTTVWYIVDFQSGNPPAVSATIHYALYVLEASLLCLFGRQLRIARDLAAKGEDWQRHLVKTAGEGIWMVDPDGVITYANPRIAEILGCGVDQIEGHQVDAFLFPEDLSAERIRFQNRRTGTKEQYDRRLRRTDGSEVWTLACSSPYAGHAKDAALLTMMTDITERKKAEQALRRSERMFRELFENIREGVYQTSPDGRILAANPELLRMLDFSSQEELNVVGVVRDTFVDADLHQRLRDRLERDSSYANVEFQLRTRDQRVITVRENARVVRDDAGNVLYYEGTLTDVTEKLRFEKQRREAQKMEALGRLAGGIARDFRGIGTGMLTGVRQALDLLPKDSPARPRLDGVLRSMHSAAALTRQILDFSQRKAGRDEHHDETAAAIDLNALVVHLESTWRGLVNPETPFLVSLCDKPARVLADPGHIEQILNSFVIHARQFGEGVESLELTTSIDDAGPGAATAAPFVSLSVRSRSALAAARMPEPRPWLGMATSQAILAQYGGVMTAVVEPRTPEFGPGVRYSLYLPLASATHLAPTANDARLAAFSGPVSGTVLLVEEEPLIRELSRDMLERQGFRVLTAGSAEEAEGIAHGRRDFDVLIIAWETDGGRGAGLVQLLREIRPGLRVLFITGYADGSPDRIPAPEGSAFLPKPFSGEALGRKVRQLLDRSRT